MLDALAALCQALLYCGIVASCGAVFAEATLTLDAAATHQLRLTTRIGAVLLVLASVAIALTLVERLGGSFDETTLSALFVSNVGAAHVLRVIGAVMLLVTVGDSDDGFTNGLRVSYAGLIAASFLFSGHAAAEAFSAGLLASVHVAIAGWWVGALIAMRKAYLDRHEAFAALVTRFSKFALVAISVLVLFGVVLIVALLDFDVGITAYIELLAVKVTLACCVLALAIYNKLRLTPRVLAGDRGSITSLRSMINLELIVIAAVLAATAIMTTYTSPHE